MDGDIIAIGFMVAMIILAAAWAKRIAVPAVGPRPQVVKLQGRNSVAVVPSSDRQKALQVYESLAKEKLEVLKTALAMGYTQEDLARLDARLERLIGREQLEQLARGEVPGVSADLANLSLSDEQRRLKELRTAQ
jgi:hypothetical protein